MFLIPGSILRINHNAWRPYSFQLTIYRIQRY